MLKLAQKTCHKKHNVCLNLSGFPRLCEQTQVNLKGFL